MKHHSFLFVVIMTTWNNVCDADLFCYACGKLTSKRNLNKISRTIQSRYNQYFYPVKMGDQEKSFAPHKICSQCVSGLSLWASGKKSKKKYLSYDWPMSWRDPVSHPDDCYFCCNSKKGKYGKQKKNLVTVCSVTTIEGEGLRIPKNNYKGNFYLSSQYVFLYLRQWF